MNILNVAHGIELMSSISAAASPTGRMLLRRFGLGPPPILPVVWLPLFGSEPARYACATRFGIPS